MKTKMLEELIGAKYKQTANRAMDMYDALWQFAKKNDALANAKVNADTPFWGLMCTPYFSWTDPDTHPEEHGFSWIAFSSKEMALKAVDEVMIPLMKRWVKEDALND